MGAEYPKQHAQQQQGMYICMYLLMVCVCIYVCMYVCVNMIDNTILTATFLKQARVRLGHYANRGFGNPMAGKHTKHFTTLELTDYATIRMSRSKVITSVLSHVFPFPIRFKQIWHFVRGDRSMWAWKPVPPEHFIALGMVCTSTG